MQQYTIKFISADPQTSAQRKEETLFDLLSTRVCQGKEERPFPEEQDLAADAPCQRLVEAHYYEAEQLKADLLLAQEAQRRVEEFNHKTTLFCQERGAPPLEDWPENNAAIQALVVNYVADQDEVAKNNSLYVLNGRVLKATGQKKLKAIEPTIADLAPVAIPGVQDPAALAVEKITRAIKMANENKIKMASENKMAYPLHDQAKNQARRISFQPNSPEQHLQAAAIKELAEIANDIEFFRHNQTGAETDWTAMTLPKPKK